MQSFTKLLSGKQVELKLDNMCAIHYINNQGGVIAQLDLLTKQIYNWCAFEKNFYTSILYTRKRE